MVVPALLGMLALAASPQTAGLTQAFSTYWAARDAGDARRATVAIEREGAPFDSVWSRLARGRAYRADVARGRLDLTRRGADGHEYHFVVLVPQDYGPARRYPVRVYLHGGVNRPAWTAGGKWWRRYDGLDHADRISVFPASWSDALWWQANQVDNLRAILRQLKHTYNVDENRVYLVGVSDGASGAYFYAFRDPTPWAAFLPFIGHPAVLSNPRLNVDGEMHIPNLTNRPLFIVNGGLDRLYPVRSLLPFLELFQQAGVEFVFRPKLESGHDVQWWPEESDRIETFIAEHPRQPFADRLAWETERTDRYHRVDWALITALGPAAGESEFEDVNTLTGRGGQLAFRQDLATGRIEIERQGNLVQVKTRGITQYRLLISPLQFDLREPITVVTNGEPSFDEMVQPDVHALLSWAAEDDDRSMLFAAEITVDLRPSQRPGNGAGAPAAQDRRSAPSRDASSVPDGHRHSRSR